MPANHLKNSVDIELIHEAVKYILQVSKVSPTSYFVVINDSTIDIEAHRLTDGGLLVSIDGSSYTTYMKEDVSSYRVIIGNRTCVFEKENDPTILRSPSAGKLLNFAVEDGGHVFAGEVYAEIEVMKMVMELRVQENGCVHYVKRPGAALDAGGIIAHLQLDDPSRVQTAKPFEGKLPKSSTAQTMYGDKLHQVFTNARNYIDNILAGYCLPQPYFPQKMKESVDTLTRCLKDPALPLFELQVKYIM